MKLWHAVLIPALAAAALAAPKDDDPRAPMRKDIGSVMDAVSLRRDAAGKAGAVALKYRPGNVMEVFLPKAKGGWGFARGPDGIEQTLTDLSLRRPSQKWASAHSGALRDVGLLAEAVAEITHFHAPAKPVKGVGLKQWQALAGDMKMAARALADFRQTTDPGKAQDAARALLLTCNRCHAALGKKVARPRDDLGKDFAEVLHEVSHLGPSELAETAAKRHGLKHLMSHAFDDRRAGGLGLGPGGDGAATKVYHWSLRPLGERLPREKRNVVQAARLGLAVAEMARYVPAPAAKAGLGPREWKRYVEDMRAAARALEAAAVKDDAKGIHRAARRLDNACQNCHSDFRDR